MGTAGCRSRLVSGVSRKTLLRLPLHSFGVSPCARLVAFHFEKKNEHGRGGLAQARSSAAGGRNIAGAEQRGFYLHLERI